MATQSTIRLRRSSVNRPRSAAILVMFALGLAIVLLGMIGLVIDGGRFVSTHRQLQNAADAAALAAAKDLMSGLPEATARGSACKFVQVYNGFLTAPAPTINIPPQVSDQYKGREQYVEVVANSALSTFFIQVIRKVSSTTNIQARAVAGYESIAGEPGLVALDPSARPGIAVQGGATVTVNGQIADNSEGGGVDENGVPVNNGNSGHAASTGNNALLKAKYYQIVGGVDVPSNFRPFDLSSTASVLHCNQLPIPDPLITLPTPTRALGVSNFMAGSIKVTSSSFPKSSELQLPNTIEGDQLVLYPGIYDSITINGTNAKNSVKFLPGIYVLRATKNNQSVLQLTGGNVIAQGIMFYNTGGDYNADTPPDANDGSNSPPAPDTTTFGSVQLNSSVALTPIDTNNNKYTYVPQVSPKFNGVLFYQRRLNTQTLTLSGNGSTGALTGTLYAKWANVQLSGQATYHAQLIVGSLSFSGGTEVTINAIGQPLGRAPTVFLVE